MPIVSRTDSGAKSIINVTFVEGEDGADACLEMLTSKYAKSEPKSEAEPTPKKPPLLRRRTKKDK